MTDQAKESRRAYKRAYYRLNADKINSYQRRWRKANPEKVKAYQEKYWNKKGSSESSEAIS